MLKILKDNEINRDLFRRHLEQTGDRTILASDSPKGVTKTPAVRVAFALRNRHRSRNHL